MSPPAAVRRLFDWKIRGVRWIEIIGVVCVAAMLCSVYLVKAGAQREATRMAELEADIAEDRQRVRLLRAEAARLESPARLDALSKGLGLAPIDADQRVQEAELDEVEPAPEAPTVPVEETAQ
ncbi:MAG: cell division protein [Alphaproteobacteria bacterium]|nr:cell division protein [Alphaproteobacteria bacterium]MBU1526368.1 cell division protein [Alphaproteobacteria bacterium]MBU2117458.1 cell division protein [Alphaproteobacteria bacterium]MBU2351487.1 cell division protein [Alphaproteobacteria bacterium]MBU2383341.1 cell division protein [Alphaproteobacteria bacterium]